MWYWTCQVSCGVLGKGLPLGAQAGHLSLVLGGQQQYQAQGGAPPKGHEGQGQHPNDGPNHQAQPPTQPTCRAPELTLNGTKSRVFGRFVLCLRWGSVWVTIAGIRATHVLTYSRMPITAACRSVRHL